MRLQDKVAVVTGGGRGIGRYIALGLASEGANVIVTARTISEIDEVAAEITSLGPTGLAVHRGPPKQIEPSCRCTIMGKDYA